MTHHPFRVDGRLSRLPYFLWLPAWAIALFLAQPVVLGLSGFAESGLMLDQLLTGNYEAYGAAVDRAVHATDAWAIRYLVLGLLFVGMFGSFLALTARRLHDIGRPGYYAWISVIPFVGVPAVFAVLILLPGDAAANQYGPASRGRGLQPARGASPAEA